MLNKLLTILLITISFFGYSQPKHHLGYHFGTQQNYGLSYRYWPNKIGIEATFLPTIMAPLKKSYNQKLTFGISVLYTIKDYEKVDLFGYFSNVVISQQNKSDNPTFIIDPYVFNSALGLGLKIDFLEDLNFNFQFGYGAYNYNTKSWKATMVVEGGLYYNF